MCGNDPRHGGASAAIHADLELAKWVALVTMTVDHFGKIVAPESWFLPTHAVGRLAYPLFAGIIGLRLAVAPSLVRRYLARLLPWAVVSQPIFVLAGRQWTDLNILVTLAAGVSAFAAIRDLRTDAWPRGIALMLTAVAIAPFVDFGPAGVAAVPLVAVCARDRHWQQALMVAVAGVFANLVVTSPHLEAVDFVAAGAGLVVWASTTWRVVIPRLPTHAFYAYYPLHLLILDRIDRWLWPMW
jgi:hypothetical protein